MSLVDSASLASTWLPFGFHLWSPWVQGATLFLLTFLSEDLTTISAALLYTADALTWEVAFLGSYLGICVGDMGIYGLGRGVGRPLLEWSAVRRFLRPAAVARSEQWFARKGLWVLLLTRLLPGTRFPTYLVAGFLRVPVAPFLLFSLLAGAVWALGIFGLARLVGPVLFDWVRAWKTASWLALVMVGGLLLVWRGYRWRSQNSHNGRSIA